MVKKLALFKIMTLFLPLVSTLPALAELSEVGPINPQNGFPLWYEDTNGLRIELGLDPALNLFDPPIPGNAFSEQIGFGAEGFYWIAESAMDIPPSSQLPLGGSAFLRLALEYAFANEEPANGDQMVFSRVRLRIDTPVAGTYRIIHPYGVEVFENVPAGDRAINSTVDVGFLPLAFNEALNGPIDPFLVAVDPPAPAGFVGGGPLLEQTVTGSPFGTNFFRIEGPEGADMDGVGNNFVETNLFMLSGKIFSFSPNPAAIRDLSALPGGKEGEIKLTWTSVGNDGQIGDITNGHYRIAYSVNPSHVFDVDNFNVEIATNTNPAQPHSYTSTGLTAGATYYLRIWTGDAADNFSAVSNAASAMAQVDVTRPSALTDLVAVRGENEGEIKLTWTSTGDDELTGNISDGKIRIKYTTEPNFNPDYVFSVDNYDIEIDTNAAPGQTQSYLLTGLFGGFNYHVRVWFADEMPNFSDVSNAASAMAQTDLIAPSAITDLVAEPGLTEGKIRLTWTSSGDNGPSGDIIGGKIRIKYTTAPDYNFSVDDFSAELPFSAISGLRVIQNIQGLAGGTTYYFRVWTTDDKANFSSVSNAADAMAQVDVTPPNAINNLAAGPGAKEGEIKLSWRSQGDDGFSGNIIGGKIRIKSTTDLVYNFNVNDFDVEISTNLTPFQFQSYTLTGLSASSFYNIRIWTADEMPNFSAVSNAASATAQVDVAPPSTIGNLAALPGDNEAEIKLSWTSPGDDGLVKDITNGKIRIKYTTDPNHVFNLNDYSLEIATNAIAGQAQSYVLTNLNPSVTYHIRVWTIDEMPNFSDVSNPASAMAQIDKVPPTSIADLIAVTGTTEGNIKLSWTSPGDNGTNGNITGGKVRIKYTTDPDYNFNVDDFNLELALNTTPGSQRIYTLHGLSGGATYYARVWTADEMSNFSAISNAAQATAQLDVTAPAPVASLTAAPGTNEGDVVLAWNATGDDGTSGNIAGGKVRLKYTTDPNYSFNSADFNIELPVNTTPGQVQSFILTGLTGGAPYHIRIWTADEVLNFSSISNPASAIAQVDVASPAAIATLSAVTGANPGEVNLAWNASGDDGTLGNIAGGKVRVAYSTDPNHTFNVNNYNLELTTDTVSGQRQSLTLAGLNQGATYYIKVWTSDELLNFSPDSNLAGALPGNFPPQILNTPSPSDNSNSVARNTVLTWNSNDIEMEPLKYDVLFGKTNPPAFVTRTDTTTYELLGLEPSATYFWQIKAIDPKGSVGEGPVWKFTTTNVAIAGRVTGLADFSQLSILSLPASLALDFANLIPERVHSTDVTTANGEFGVSSLPTGTYDLYMVEKNNFKTLKKAAAVNVVDGHTTTVNFDLTATETSGELSDGSISGTITDKTGNPLPSLVLLQENGVTTGFGVTDISGKFRFAGLQYRDYELIVSAEKYLTEKAQISIGPGNRDITASVVLGNLTLDLSLNQTVNSDDSVVSLDIPRGAFTNRTGIIITKVSASEVSRLAPAIPGSLSAISNSNSVVSSISQSEIIYKIRAVGATFQLNDNSLVSDKKIKLNLKYGPGIDPRVASQFKIYRLQGSNWELVPGTQKVNLPEGRISCEINSLGVFRVLITAPGDLGNLVVFPNPYKPNSSLGHDKIVFNGLTGSAKIKIYSLSGIKVREMDKNDSLGAFTWDARNEVGEQLASGLYLYIVTGENGQEKKGKIAIIK